VHIDQIGECKKSDYAFLKLAPNHTLMGFVELLDNQEKILKKVIHRRKISTATFSIEKISRKDKDRRISGTGNRSP
jgi:hypothetical protein